MTIANRAITSPLEAHLLREGITESVHYAQAVVCDVKGRNLLSAGDPNISTFIRSALKPFQALAVTTTGTIAQLGLTNQDLAIMCGSHTGTIEHTRQVFNILWRADIDPSALQCPIPEGKTYPIEYNCSGKHAGMLAVCKNKSWPLHSYMDRAHPIQQLILRQVAQLLNIPGLELVNAHDDCGVPTYAMKLFQMATLYAKLSGGDNLDLERIVRAMTSHPYMVAGPDRFDTELMTLTQGSLVSKSGAEGIQCIGRIGENVGLAIKVKDGSSRAKYAIAISLLRQMGWIDPLVAEQLTDKFLSLSTYKRLEVIGELS
jgi:L-asparaginase